MNDLQDQLEKNRMMVDVDSFDITVRELIRMTSEGELIRAPEYQRNFRWPTENESRLIESLLLGLPVPSIFVATNKDGRWELVDGLQRVSTLIHFALEIEGNENIFRDIEKDSNLRLGNLDKLTHFNGLKYEDFPSPIKFGFMKRIIKVTALSDKSDYSVRFDTFERLNNGGVLLTPQEVRACVYRGRFATLINDLANLDDFKNLVKLRKNAKDDGTLEELVLKFFAYGDNRETFDGTVTKTLNDYMESKLEIREEELEKMRREFSQAASALLSVTKGKFMRSGFGTTPLIQLEASLVAMGDILKAGDKLDVRDGWIDDAVFLKNSTKGTNSKSRLNNRINRAKYLLTQNPKYDSAV